MIQFRLSTKSGEPQSKPDPKPRSAFLPVMLILVGLVICAGVVFTFVPIATCPQCPKQINEETPRYVFPDEVKDGDPVPFAYCLLCRDRGEIPLAILWTMKPKDTQ